jgi:hypothetical protein
MLKVNNIHERELKGTPEQVGKILDSLSSKWDALWPNRSWPRMKFDRPLDIGAAGGHGPIRYFVEEYEPGKSVTFRFTGPKGFDGYHGFEVLVREEGSVVLRHTVRMTARFPAFITWPMVFRPLHDALIEDALSNAQVSLGQLPEGHRWSIWVKFLRRAMSGGNAGKM